MNLLQHASIELINSLRSAFFKDELGYVVAKDVLHQTSGIH